MPVCYFLTRVFLYTLFFFDVILHHQYEPIFKKQLCTFGLPAPQMKVSKDTKISKM